MNRQYQKIQKRASLAGAICGILIGLPAMAASPRLDNQLLAQVNPNPSIFNEPPYNRSRSVSPDESGTSPTTEPTPGQGAAPSPVPSPTPAIQPPLPEQQQPPSAVVTPTRNGEVTVTLINETGATISYQVIGNTNVRSLRGKSNVLLQNLPTPVTVTFHRQDSGLLKVTPTASEPGTLEVRFTETTDLGTDKSTMRIQRTGAVFLN